MKITMTLLVRDEEDVIEDHIRFHAERGVDAFIVMDNLSADATPAIVTRLASEFDITLLHQSDDTYDQGVWVTDMARQAAAQGADWVINSDADEFWLTGGGLHEWLARQPGDVGSVDVARHNAVVIRGEDTHPARSTVFETSSLNAKGTPLPGKALHRASAGVTVAQGNHAVAGVPGRRIAAEGCRILHYPYRGLARYRRKIELGGAAYARNTRLAPNQGSTWRLHHAGLQDGTVDAFYAALEIPRDRATIGTNTGLYFTETRVADALDPVTRARADARTDLIRGTQEEVAAFCTHHAALIDRVIPEDQPKRPMYYNLAYATGGARAHLARIEEVSRTNRFADLRDAFSLFPRNTHVMPYLARLLEITHPRPVARLRADLRDRRVALHTSCLPRLDRTAATIASFAPLGDALTHVTLTGEPGTRSEDATPLRFDYADGHLRVPVPDDYENLHRKLFYAYMLLHLVAHPALVVKLDDNILLDDPQRFTALLDQAAPAAYAGRRVGSPRHDAQWHGWHVGKCADPLLETRGYQYPLPANYAAGGYGYTLGAGGLEACAYTYLTMKAFFAMPSVGLEDVCVGHAMAARDIPLTELSEKHALLALPGLTTKERAASGV